MTTNILFLLITNLILFLAGMTLLLRNTKKGNLLVVLMYIEVILLACNLNFITFSVYLDDLTGQLFSLSILTVAAAESAIGLAILISFYKLTDSISFDKINSLRG
jgi:NADH-quinone oxidoreductase subunit K